MSSAWGIWIALAALLLGGVFSVLHLALRDLAKAALEELGEMGRRPIATRRVQRILDDVDGHAAAMALPRIVLNMVTLIGLVVWIASLRGVGAVGWVDVVIGTALAAALSWVVGAVVALSVANHVGERAIYVFSWLVRGTHMAVAPAGVMVRFFDEVVRRLSGDRPQTEAEEAQAELLSVVEEAEREGAFDEAAREMIEAVVELRSTTVEQIMTPRTEINALEMTDDLEQVKALARSGGHSRVPVYEDNLDHIVGILYAKDLLRWMASDSARGSEGFRLKPLLREATFVPETKTVPDLLSELVSAKVHIAMVADEYGGTSGLVTIEDIVEEVFGEIWDEYEKPDEEMPTVLVDAAARSAEIDARAYIDDVNDELEPLGVALPEDEDYDTMGGFVLAKLGHIPKPGETLRYTPGSTNGDDAGDGGTGRQLLVTVLESEPTRVLKVRVQVREPGELDDAAA